MVPRQQSATASADGNGPPSTWFEAVADSGALAQKQLTALKVKAHRSRPRRKGRPRRRRVDKIFTDVMGHPVAFMSTRGNATEGPPSHPSAGGFEGLKPARRDMMPFEGVNSNSHPAFAKASATGSRVYFSDWNCWVAIRSLLLVALPRYSRDYHGRGARLPGDWETAQTPTKAAPDPEGLPSATCHRPRKRGQPLPERGRRLARKGKKQNQRQRQPQRPDYCYLSR